MDAMRKPEVIVIPPTKGMLNPKKIRTAAYARVSSDSEDQFNSFMTQMDYYTKYINANPTIIKRSAIYHHGLQMFCLKTVLI